MIIREEAEGKGLSKSTVKPLKGKATIELRDAKTGELVYQKEEHNLFTNYFQGPYTHDMAAMYTQHPINYFNLVKGVQLLNHEEREDVSNADMELSGSQVTGFGTLTVNSSQTNTKWMSYNLLESGATPTGHKWVWDANVNQCNGPISCISLITQDLNNIYYSSTNKAESRFTGELLRQSVASMPLYISKWIDDVGNSYLSNLQTGTISNPVHIDWENEILWDVERDYDNDRRIIIKRYNLNRNKVHLKFRLKPTLIDEHVITVQNSLNHDYVYNASNTHARPFSVKIEGNTMYLVKGGGTYAQNTSTLQTNLLRIIKIDLTNYSYTDEVKTLTHQFVEPFRNWLISVEQARNFHFIKDYYPISNGYVYLMSVSTAREIYKVNLNDISDITVISTLEGYNQVRSNYGGPSIVTNKNIIFGQSYNYSNNLHKYTAINISDNTCFKCTNGTMLQQPNTTSGLYQTNVNMNVYEPYYMTFWDEHEGVITIGRYTNASTNTSNSYGGLVFLEQFQSNCGMVTVNNVSPVVKTSDKTMRVIYELVEADE